MNLFKMVLQPKLVLIGIEPTPPGGHKHVT